MTLDQMRIRVLRDQFPQQTIGITDSVLCRLLAWARWRVRRVRV